LSGLAHLEHVIARGQNHLYTVYIRYCWQGNHQIYRVGQNHVHTVYTRYFGQGNHQIYGQIRCIHTILANSSFSPMNSVFSTRFVARTCICARVQCFVYTHTHTHTHTHTRVHTRTHLHTHAHTHVHTYTHSHTHTYTLTHTCTHTCKHTHTITG